MEAPHAGLTAAPGPEAVVPTRDGGLWSSAGTSGVRTTTKQGNARHATERPSVPTTRPRRVLLLPLLLLACWLGATGTAQAHTSLSSSSPAEGSTVTEPLSAVTLTFSGSVRGPEVTVAGPDGAVVSTGTATGEGSAVTVPVAPTATGPHTITWSVTSADGHDLTGTVAFDHAGPVAAPVGPEPAPSSAATPSPAAATSEPVPAQPAEAAAETPEDEGSGSGVAIGVAVAVVLLGAGGVAVGRRRRG